jgi:hypothetical protein
MQTFSNNFNLKSRYVIRYRAILEPFQIKDTFIGEEPCRGSARVCGGGYTGDDMNDKSLRRVLIRMLSFSKDI